MHRRNLAAPTLPRLISRRSLQVRERSAATDRELVRGYRRSLNDYARMVAAVKEQKVRFYPPPARKSQVTSQVSAPVHGAEPRNAAVAVCHSHAFYFIPRSPPSFSVISTLVTN